MPFRDSEALADSLINLLQDGELRNHMRKLSYRYGRKMIWREVARSYADAFEKAVSEYSAQAKTSVQSLAVTESAVLPEIRLDHLKTLTDDTGIFQHALYTVPDRRHGYCTDDNARALLVTVMNWRLFKEERILPFFRTYLSFLLYAYNRERERMRNFMSYQRQWLEEIGSEDSHGRSIWALVIPSPIRPMIH